jgi:hypothetical protein
MTRRLFAPLLVVAALAGDASAAPAPTPDAGPVVDASVDNGIGTSPVVDPDGTVHPGAGTLADQFQKEPVATATTVVREIRDGAGYRYAAAAALAALMVAGIRWGGPLFGVTDRGKALAVMAWSSLGALSTALLTSVPIDAQLFVGAAGVAWLAVGGRQWLSRLLWPRDGGPQYLTWLQPWLGWKPPENAPPTATVVKT